LSVVTAEQAFDFSGHRKIELDAGHIEVSSTMAGFSKDSLFKESGVWHVSAPKKTAAEWVIIDLESERRLNVIAIKPRPENLSQLWQGDTAILQGGNDKKTWTAITKLELNLGELNDKSWIAFALPDMDSYRYYRLYISDPNFISIAGLRVYGEGGMLQAAGRQGTDLRGHRRIELDADDIEVSSTLPGFGKENIFNEFDVWHVKVPRETDAEWVIIDLESKRRLSALAIRPRAEHLSQLWLGDTAVLQGGNDKKTWSAIAKLELNLEELNDKSWITFVLPNISSYRYYRLYISDPDFVSMAGLKVYGEGGRLEVSGRQGTDLSSYTVIELDASDIEVSSALAGFGKECCQSAKWDTFNTEDFVMIRRH